MSRTYAARKTSFTLSPGALAVAELIAGRYASGNTSLVVDVALKHLAEQSDVEQRRLVARERARRMVASTRDAWMRTFWQWLAAAFQSEDVIDNPYAPRTWSGFTIVFLLAGATAYPAEGDAFTLSAFPNPWRAGLQNEGWTFSRDFSPVDAAETVSRRIAELFARAEAVA